MRSILLTKYGRCAISGCTLEDCLDAAHILPVANNGKEVLSNMILLRADLHRLFDAGLWSLRVIDGQCRLYAAKHVASYMAAAFDGNLNWINFDWVSKSMWLQARQDIQLSTDHVLVG